jgi:DNA-binding CsgD family transcriptional regulator
VASRARSGPAAIARIISSLYDAALAPEDWPAVLHSVAVAVGSIGAAYIIWNKRVGAVEWLALTGPSTDMKADYVNHYAALSPYRPLVDTAPFGRWVRLSECLPGTVLRKSEWYNDLILRSGIGDILSARLFDTPSRVGLLSIHQVHGSQSLEAVPRAQLQALLDGFTKAARLHDRLRVLGWRSSAALQAVDQLKESVIVTDTVARVIEMNGSAERMVRLDDGLMIRNGRLCARRSFETEKLAKLIAAAAATEPTTATAGRMLVRRTAGRLPYSLSVVPLVVEGRQAAMVIVSNADENAPPARVLAELLGLTPAESRVAAAIMAGKSPSDIAVDLSLKITTLRTQIRAVLKKAGVNKQTDLIRLVSSIRMGG